VDEYLSDNEQVERLRTWWRENGWFVIGGVGLGFLVLFGWQQYGKYVDSQAEAAAAIYESLKQATEEKNEVEATTLLARLRAEYASSAYTPQAGLLVASSLLVAAPERAAEELRHVMDASSDDPELAMIARLRLARVLAYREQYDEALKLLTVNEPGEFAGRLNEVKGDIHAALGRVDEARAAYLAAMVADGAELLDRNFVQMKLNDLPNTANAADAATRAAAPAASPPAEPAASEAASATTPDAEEGA
jgi:predicted negative regulator of RcsB-dependent stress response